MKKTFCAFILILFSIMPLYASYDEALKLYQEKKYEDSLKILGEELIVEDDMKEDSPNYKIRFLAAHNHWKLGNSKSVIAHFNRCMVINKESVDPFIDLAFFQLEQQNYNDASRIANKGLAVKKSALLYYILGYVSLKQKNFWKAKELFEKANSINPELFISYNSLGIALMNLKKFSDANTAFLVANEIKPGSAEVLNNIGKSLEFMEKYKEAMIYYEQAKDLDPENETILKNIEKIKENLDK